MKKVPIEKIKKILIIRPEMIGDIIILTPLVSAIKNKLPDAKITLLIQPQTTPVVENNEEIDDYILTRKTALLSQKIELIKRIRTEKFDLAIVLEDNPTPDYALICLLAGIPYRIGDKARLLYGWIYNYGVWLNSNDPKLHQIELYGKLLEPLSIEKIEHGLTLNTNEENKNKITQLLHKLNIKNKPLVGLHIGTGGGDRALHPQTYALIADKLQADHNCNVLLLGGPKESETEKKVKQYAKNEHLSLVNLISLGELFALLSNLNVFIGVNSGPLHAAAAQKTPSVAIYVANDIRMERWLPWMTPNIVIRSQNNCTLKCSHRECQLDYCTSSIDPDEVVEAAIKLLKKRGSS